MHPATPTTVPGFMARLSSPRRPITRCSAWSRIAQELRRMTSARFGVSTAT